MTEIAFEIHGMSEKFIKCVNIRFEHESNIISI